MTTQEKMLELLRAQGYELESIDPETGMERWEGPNLRPVRVLDGSVGVWEGRYADGWVWCSTVSALETELAR
jgi:hypothetical protein